MKLSHLKQITEYLKKFSKISAIYRVSDTIVKVVFDRDDELYFEMQRSNSRIFKLQIGRLLFVSRGYGGFKPDYLIAAVKLDVYYIGTVKAS